MGGQLGVEAWVERLKYSLSILWVIFKRKVGQKRGWKENYNGKNVPQSSLFHSQSHYGSQMWIPARSNLMPATSTGFGGFLPWPRVPFSSEAWEERHQTAYRQTLHSSTWARSSNYLAWVSRPSTSATQAWTIISRLKFLPPKRSSKRSSFRTSLFGRLLAFC